MSATSTTEVTFEEGYDELKRIVARLDEDDISVHETCEQFARGKGLEKALRAYLEAKQGELKEIEEGRRLPAFDVVAPSRPATPPAAVDEFTNGGVPAAPTTGANDDDIPF